MAKPGRPETLLDHLDDGLRERIDQAIKSGANEAVVDIYRRFGLAQREVKQRSFYAYADRLRERFEQEPTQGGESEAGAVRSVTAGKNVSVETLYRLIDYVNDALDSGDVKGIRAAAPMVRALSDSIRLTHDEAAEARAAELHGIKVEQLSKELRKEVDEASNGGKTELSRDAVHDMIDKIMRGEA